MARRRYEGPRWAVVYGSYEGAEQFALRELCGAAQHGLPYVLEVAPASASTGNENHLIVAGTPENNRIIAELTHEDRIRIPGKPEAYTVACVESPRRKDRRLVVVAGKDSRGVLYGAADFAARVAGRLPGNEAGWDKAIHSLDDFSISEYPRVENRGIWTWGYVIYDYRRFLDNMARLKLNTLVVWNDCPPVNIREIIHCARKRGIKLILGFSWGWGREDLRLDNPADRRKIKNSVLREFETHYRDLDMDGLYFQTLTEHSETETGGRPLAGIARDMVNDIAGSLLLKQPNLNIWCGLHATSILDHCGEFRALDPRVTIVWEDAGVIPYAYSPVPEITGQDPHFAPELNSFGRTLAYSKKLARLRPGSPFAMVAKGWTTLDWENEFERHGPFLLGERPPVFTRERLRRKQAKWDEVNALWMNNYPFAVRFYREILECNSAGMTVLGLVEDGLFEEKIQPGVALFAETLWNPSRDEDHLRRLAMSRSGRETAGA